MPKQKKKTKVKAITGYRLHAKRLKHTGSESIRSVKFPLIGKEDKLLWLADVIRHDYQNMMGDINFSAWLSSKQNNKETYSVLQFWLDSIKAGMLFANSESALYQRAYKLSPLPPLIDRIGKAMRKKDAEFAEHIDLEKFLEAFGKAQTRNKRPQSLEYKIQSIFKENAKKTLIAKHSKKISKAISNADTAGQNEFWRKEYGFDKSIINSAAEESGTAMLRPERNIDSHEQNENTIVARLSKTRAEYKENTKLMQADLGFGASFPAFSHYFNAALEDLRSQKGQNLRKLSEQILQKHNCWEGKEKELEKRIHFLCQRAKKIEKPQAVPGWHEYRTSLGGKLQSWHSNALRQKEEMKAQIQGHRAEWENYRGHVKKIPSGKFESLHFTQEEHQSQIETALKSLSELEEGVEDNTLFDLYGDVLALLRVQGNQLYQSLEAQEIADISGMKKAPKKKDAAWAKIYKKLAKDIYHIPQFPGKAAKKRYLKFYRSIPRLEKAFVLLSNIKPEYKNVDAEIEQRLLRQLESLRSKYIPLPKQRGQKSIPLSQRCGQIIHQAFLQVYNIRLSDYERRPYDHFYRAKQARETRGKKIELPLAPLHDKAYELTQALKIDWAKWKNYIEHDNFKEILELLEIEKIRISILQYICPGFVIKAKDYRPLLKDYTKLEAYLRIRKKDKKWRGLDLSALQTLLFSEMRGTLQKMSRKTYIERSVVQIVDPEKKYPLGHPRGDASTWMIWRKDDELKKDEIEANKNHLLECKGYGQQDAKGQKAKKTFILQGKELYLRSSKYQMQFLCHFYHNKDSALVGAELRDFSLIAEEEYILSWDMQKEAPILKKADKNHTRLFISVPFALKPAPKHRENRNKRMMGIDIGEYGLAYYIIEGTRPVKFLKKGFIYEPTIHNILHYRKELQERQARSTFAMPSSKLARLRKQAIGTLRNRIHDLVLRYNATPVYESEVSHFESGSKRVTAIYNSLKRADTPDWTKDVDKHEVAHIWGKREKIGNQIGAYATSYTCCQCRRSVYEDSIKQALEKKNFSMKEHAQKKETYVLKVLGQELLAFGKNAADVKEKPIDAVKKYARPPLESILAEGQLKLNKNSWLQKRGNQAIFRCPFAACRHSISDADIQAAYIIVMKRLAKEQIQSQRENSKNKKSSDKKSKHSDDKEIQISMEYLLSFAHKYDPQSPTIAINRSYIS